MKSSQTSIFKTIASLPRETWLGFSASMIQAYNACLLMFMIPYLAPRIFTDLSVQEGALKLHVLVMMGMIAYPIGALLYGYVGDRVGRKAACTTSTLGLALATGMKGLFPLSYGPEFVCAGLLLLNFTQQFFAGGEYRSAIIYSLEHAGDKRQGMLSGLSCLFAVIGLASAQGMSYLSSLDSSGVMWRLCFLLGACAGVLIFILRQYCTESPIFEAKQTAALGFSNMWAFARSHGANIFRVIVVGGFFATIYCYIFYYLPLAWGAEVNAEKLSDYLLIGLATYGVVLLFSGILADKFGLKRVMGLGAFFVAVGIVPLLTMGAPHILFVMEALTIGACLLIGPLHSFCYRIFPTEARCRGVMIGDAFSVGIFAGSVVPTCLKIQQLSGSVLMTSVLPIGMSVLAIWALTTAKFGKERAAGGIACVQEPGRPLS